MSWGHINEYLEDRWPTHLQGKTSSEEKTLTDNSSYKK